MQTVLITGANGNLGQAVTSLFLDRGYQVIATVAREESKSELRPHNQLQVEAVDLTDEEKTSAFIERLLSSFPTIDAALLLVGGFAMGDVKTTAGSDIKKQIALNFDTAYHVTRPLFQHMLKRGTGRIVFIGSRPALQAAAGKGLIAYALSKSLLFKLAEYLNAEAKGTNVTVTVVVPSTIDTPPNRKSMPDVDPGNWVKPEALAEILEFVVSNKSAPLRETVLKVYNNA